MLLLPPMKKLCLLVLASLTLAWPAYAMDNALRAGLLKLDPQTRLEQRCDAEVLDRITHDDHKYKADRVVAYAFATPEMSADAIRSPGALAPACRRPAILTRTDHSPVEKSRLAALVPAGHLTHTNHTR
ncbi:MAG: DUF930 domain-containing protein [Mesorhizobium sp.]|nr:MAG: DUF930 domain-containing protein [Mesorhizobium sp.]